MKKRFLSLLLTLALCFGLAVPAMAASFEIETIVEPVYEAVSNFSDGYAAVKQDGKWGYINEDGKMVISPQFDWAGEFSEGIAVVATLETTVYAEGTEWEDTEEEYVLSLLAEDGTVTPLYKDDLYEGTIRLTHSADNEYAEPIEDAGWYWFCQNGVVNVKGTPYTPEGEEIVPKTPVLDTYGEAFDFWEMTGPCVGGVIPMRAYWSYEYASNICCFYMDASGNVTRTFPTAEISEGKKGVTCVYAPEQECITAVYAGYNSDWDWEFGWGVMDMSGKWVAQPVYDRFRYYLSGRFFCDGLMTVSDKNGKFGAIDKNGKTVIPFEYDFLNTFSEGMSTVIKDGKSYYIDLAGKVYQPGALDGGAANASAVSFFANGVAPVYIAEDGQAYCIQNVPKDGVLPAIAGTQNLGSEVYFPDYVEGSDDLGTLSSIGHIVAIKENGKWGYAKLDFKLDLPDESAMDSWAYDEVCKAIEAGLVPNELQNQYKSNITRADFALLFLEVASEITGKTVEELVKDVTGKDLDELVKSCPFTDTNDRDIVAANALGIIKGYGNGKCGPYKTITRQDAATMLLRTAVAIKADAMDVWGDKIAAANIKFNDGEAFAGYAQEAIQVMAALDVMKGTGEGNFSPTATYTRQQSFITAYRLMTQLISASAE